MRRLGSAACGLLAGLAMACAHTPPPPPSSGAEAFEQMVRRVETVRGLPAPRPVQVRVVSPEVLRGEVERAVAARRSPADVARYQAGLVAVGLWPPDRSLLDDLLSVLGEEVAGLYVAPERALLVVSEEPVPFDEWIDAAVQDPEDRVVLHHELVHLLQHQRYPRLFDDDDDLFFRHDDAGIAVQSAFEGDAVYFGLRADGESPPPDLLAASFDLQLAASEGAVSQAPLLLQELLGFPYTQGYELAWREGASLLEGPPISTEQALHEDRRREAFTIFDLQPLADALPAGCEAEFENGVGELQLSLLLRSHGVDEARAREAAAGWDGDRYLAARCDGEPALFWITRWDSEPDAEEFAAAHAALERRPPFRRPLQTTRDGREVVVVSAALRAWSETARSRAREARIASFEQLLDFSAAR